MMPSRSRNSPPCCARSRPAALPCCVSLRPAPLRTLRTTRPNHRTLQWIPVPWHSGVRDQTTYLPCHQRRSTPAIGSHRPIYPGPQRQPAAAAERSFRAARWSSVFPPRHCPTSTLRYARAVSRETSTSTCRPGHGVSRETPMPAVPPRRAPVPSHANPERRGRGFSARRSLSKGAASVSGRHKRPRPRGDTRRAAWRLALRGTGERRRGDSRLGAPVGARPDVNAMPAKREHPQESFRPTRRPGRRRGTAPGQPTRPVKRRTRISQPAVRGRPR